MAIKHVGSHLLVDAWEAPSEILDDADRVRHALEEAVAAGGVTLVDMCVHEFSPYGVTATATLAESHATVHTWPEHGYFSADFFFCGSGDTHRALEVLRHALHARRVKVQEIKRGFEQSRVRAGDLVGEER